MLIKTLPVGQLETNCYVVTDEKTLECVIIDPGAESNVILDYVEANKLIPRAIFITHAHFDHITALPDVFEQTGAPVYVHEKEYATGTHGESAKLQSIKGLRNYAEGDKIDVGAVDFLVMETPGHTMGSVTLLCKDKNEPSASALFTGDTLFCGSCGRTDLGGDMDMMQASLRRLSALPGDYEVYPGHAESTTLESERRFNYYIKHANSEFPNQ